MKCIFKFGVLICVMSSTLFAGLVFDAEMNNQIVLADTIGNFNNYYEFDEYSSQLWVAIDHRVTTNVGGEVRVQVDVERAVGVVIHDNAASIGDLWNYTIDLKNDNSDINDSSTITLIVQGLPDPWSSTAWKNRIAASWWTFDQGVGTELLNLSIDPNSVSSEWTTFSGDLDLGAGYEYIAYALRFSNIGNFNSSLRIDNMDIISIPEPILFGWLGFGFFGFIRRK